MKQKKLILVKLIGIGDDNSNISEYNHGHVKLDWLPTPKVDRVNESDKYNKSDSKNNEDDKDDNNKNEDG